MNGFVGVDGCKAGWFAVQKVDQLLRSNRDGRHRMRETHPELLFWALNGRKAMHNSKKRRAGYGERLAVLRALFPQADEVAAQALARFPRHRVARDDILDALAAAVSGLLSGGDLTSIPVQPERDAWGLPMEIVYWEAHAAGGGTQNSYEATAAGLAGADRHL